MTNPDKTENIRGYINSMKELSHTYNNHDFDNGNAKKAVKRKIEQNYKSALLLLNNKENSIKIGSLEMNCFKEIERKFKYFSIESLLFNYISKNKKLYEILKK